MNLFKHLLEKNLVSYGRVIDWWLSEGKFEDWAKDDVGNLTKKLHLLQGFSKNRDLHYESAKRLSFPKKAQRYPQVWISKGSSEGRDWVRHIRNGIAHGNVTVRANKGEPIRRCCSFLFGMEQPGEFTVRYIIIERPPDSKFPGKVVDISDRVPRTVKAAGNLPLCVPKV